MNRNYAEFLRLLRRTEIRVFGLLCLFLTFFVVEAEAKDYETWSTGGARFDKKAVTWDEPYIEFWAIYNNTDKTDDDLRDCTFTFTIAGKTFTVATGFGIKNSGTDNVATLTSGSYGPCYIVTDGATRTIDFINSDEKYDKFYNCKIRWYPSSEVFAYAGNKGTFNISGYWYIDGSSSKKMTVNFSQTDITIEKPNCTFNTGTFSRIGASEFYYTPSFSVPASTSVDVDVSLEASSGDFCGFSGITSGTKYTITSVESRIDYLYFNYVIKKSYPAITGVYKSFASRTMTYSINIGKVVMPTEYDAAFCIETDKGRFVKAQMTSLAFKDATYLKAEGEWNQDELLELLHTLLLYPRDGNTVLESVDFSNMVLTEDFDMRNFFEKFTALKTVILPEKETDVEILLSATFSGCTSLESVENLDKILNITYLGSCFNGCSSLKKLKFSSKESSIPIDCSYAFDGCTNLLSVENFSRFTNITDLYGTFTRCTVLPSVDFSKKINTNKLSPVNLFYDCSNIESIDLSSFVNIESLSGVASFCSNLTSISFSNQINNNPVSLSMTFYQCYKLKQISNLSKFTNITDLDRTFLLCEELEYVEFSTTKNTNNVLFAETFHYCEKLFEIKNLSSFSNLTDFNYAFRCCKNLTYIELPSVAIPASNTFYEINPNCIKYLYGASSVPSAWSSVSNVVLASNNNTSASIVLQDGYPYYAPTTIQATSISLTRQCYRDGYFETLALPFKVSKIMFGSYDYTSCFDKEKFFALKDEKITFVPTSSMEANTAYLLRYNQSPMNSTVSFTFTGSGTLYGQFSSSSPFQSCYIDKTGINASDNIYMLKLDGDETVFSRALDGSQSKGFRAYIQGGASGTDRYSVNFGMETSQISETVDAEDPDREVSVYSVSGVLVRSNVKRSEATADLPGGMYIVEGKKIVVM